MIFSFFSFDINEIELNQLRLYPSRCKVTFENFTSFVEMNYRIETSRHPIVILMDIDQNKVEKLEFVKSIKKKKVEIICVSSTNDCFERIAWREAGIMSFIIRPFHVKEIAIIIEKTFDIYDDFVISDMNFIVNLTEQKVFYKGDILHVSPHILKVITFFIRNEGVLISRNEFIENIYGDYYLSDRNIDTTIKQCRKIISPKFIKTVRGHGHIYLESELYEDHK